MFAFVFLLFFVLYPLGGNFEEDYSDYCPDGFIYSPYALRCIKYFTVKRMWRVAHKKCSAINSTLPTYLRMDIHFIPFRRLAINKHIKDKCRNTLTGGDEFWTAGRKLKYPEGEYFGWYNGSGIDIEPIPKFGMIRQTTTKDLGCLSLEIRDYSNFGMQFNKCDTRQCYFCLYHP